MAMLNPGMRSRARRFVAPALLFFFASTEGCQIISGLSALETTERPPAATTCEPSSTRTCYSGPEGTEGVGICAAGTQTCKADGSGWEACSGEVTPDTSLENCAEGVDLNCDGRGACTGAMVWSRTDGGTAKIIAHAAAVDSTGDVILVGAYSGTAMIGKNTLNSVDLSTEGFVAKLDPTGLVKWVQSYSGLGDDSVISVAVTPDDFILVTGQYTSTFMVGNTQLLPLGGGDIFVAKLDKDGTTIWAKGVGDGAIQAAVSVATDSVGNAVLTGYFEGTIDFGAGSLQAAGRDGFVVKYDGASNLLWAKSITGDGEQHANGVAVDSAGDVVVTGVVTGSVQFAGAPLEAGAGSSIFVGKLSGDAGEAKWSKLFGSPNPLNLGISAARAGLKGEAVVVGKFGGMIDFGAGPATASSIDLFIVKLDQGGGVIWGKALGSAGDDVAHEVAVDPFGNITVAGEFAGELAFGGEVPDLQSRGESDGFLAKLASDGAVQWAIGAGGLNADGAYGVAVDKLGAAYATGVCGSPFLIGDTEVPTMYTQNIFVAKLDP